MLILISSQDATNLDPQCFLKGIYPGSANFPFDFEHADFLLYTVQLIVHVLLICYFDLNVSL